MKCRRRRFCTSSVAVANRNRFAIRTNLIRNSSCVAVVYGVHERSTGEDHIGRREHVYEYLWTYAVFNVSSSSFRLDIILRSRFRKFDILLTLFIHFTGWNILFLRCCLFHMIYKTKYLFYLRAIKTLQLLFHQIFIQICLVYYHYLYK